MQRKWDKWYPVGLALAALLSFTLVVLLFGFKHEQKLVAVPQFDYTNEFADRGYDIVCSFKANRPELKPEGGDVRVGDRLVRDCRVVSR